MRSPVSAPPGLSPRFWALCAEERLAGARVLDVGTGWGRLALALGPRAGRVVGIDREPALVAEAERRAAAAGLSNVTFLVADAEQLDFRALTPDPLPAPPDLVVAHLYFSPRLVEQAARVLRPGTALAFVAFHADQWLETGRRSRFAYEEDQVRRLLAEHGFAVVHEEVEREVKRFETVEQGLAAAVGLEERWRADGRWFRYIEFLEEGGRTLTRSHLIVKARRS